MHFRYRALTGRGEIVEGEVEALSQGDVTQRIDHLGLILIEARQVPAASPGGWRIPRSGLRGRDVTSLLREIALLLSAGLSLSETLRLLTADSSGRREQELRALAGALSEGATFAEAITRRPGLLAPTAIAVVRAGEAAGRLADALRAVVEERTRAERLGERIAGAIRYPLFLIVSAVLVLLFFLLQVVPQFESVFADLQQNLNSGTRLVLGVSATLREAPLVTVAGIAVPLLFLVAALASPRGRAALATLAAALPVSATLVRDAATSRLLGSIGVLLRAGVTLPDALKLLRESELGGIGERLDRTLVLVRSGRRFADALSETAVLPPLAVGMVRVGEEAGALADVCAQASRFYEDKLTRGLDRVMGAMGPAAIVLVSLLVGGLVVSIMSALLSLTELAL